MHKIVICGPESTGKSTLAASLAKYYNTVWVKEYAREYVENLGRKYTYDDVEIIALEQIKQLKASEEAKSNLIFFDTGLIITKVWFSEVFKRCPKWLDDKIIECRPSLYLLCYFDLNWEFDPVRENGNDNRRAYLFDKYHEEIKNTGCKYQIIKGFNQERFNLAIETIEKRILKC